MNGKKIDKEETMKSSKMKKMKKRILAMLLCTTMMLNTGVSALADEVVSDAHVHTETCYEKHNTGNLVCTKAEVSEAEAHVHADECYEVTSTQELTCTLAETEGHSHGDGCVETTKVLDCDAEHAHDGGCYTTETNIVCGQEEVEAHAHGEGCYTTVENKTQICVLEEVEAHTHGDECYEWEENLVCTIPEGTPVQLNETEEVQEPVKEQSEEVVEEPVVEDVVLTYTSEDGKYTVTAEAKPEIMENVAALEATLITETTKVEEITQKLIARATEAKRTSLGFEAFEYKFFDAEGNEVVVNGEVRLSISYEDEMIPEAADAENVDAVETALLETAEEGFDEINGLVSAEAGAVKEVVYTTEAPEELILAWSGDVYRTLPNYEDDEVVITLAGTEYALQNVVGFNVTPIKEDNEETKEQYAEVAQQLEEKIAEENEAKEVVGFLAYDITLVDADGNELEPQSGVRVSMEYREAAAPESVAEVEEAEVTIHHFEEDEKGEVKQIVDMVAEETIEAAVTLTEKAEIEKAEFVTSGFSTFTITWSANNRYINITVKYVDENGEEIDDVETDNITFYENGKIQDLTVGSIRDFIEGYEYQNTYLIHDDKVVDDVDSLRMYRARAGNRKYYFQYHADGKWNNWSAELGEGKEDSPSFEGDVFIEYEKVVNYDQNDLPTITVNNESEVTVTIRHYLNDEELYRPSVYTMSGQWVINDISVAGNYTVKRITKVDTSTGQEVLLTTDDSINEDTEYRVYYLPISVDYVSESDVQMFDYQVNGGELGGELSKEYKSINHPNNFIQVANDSNITSIDSNQKMTGGKHDQPNQPYKCNTYIATGKDINAYTNGSTVVTGIISGVDYLTGKLELPKNTSGAQIYEPGFFVADESLIGHDVLHGYTLKFNQEGDTYTLQSVLRDNNQVVAANAGSSFYPLDHLAKDNDLANNLTETHNYYFGMRYDIEFTIGDYIGDLEYYFSGDDDLWVVLDAQDQGGKVVVDIGGIHQSAEATVDLWDALYGENFDKLSLSTEEKNKTHTLTILYMERGGYLSNCNMRFTLPNSKIVNPVKNNALTIKKTISGNLANMDEKFIFHVQIDGAENTYELGHNQSEKIYIPKGTYPTIKVWEDKKGYVHTVTTQPESSSALSNQDGIQFVMPDSDTQVTFNNEKSGQYVKVVKTWEGGNTADIPDSLQIALKNGTDILAEAVLNKDSTGKMEKVLLVEGWNENLVVDETLNNSGLWKLKSAGWKQNEEKTDYLKETGLYEGEEVECYVYNLVNEFVTTTASVEKVWHDGENAYDTRMETLDLTLKYLVADESGVAVENEGGTDFKVTVRKTIEEGEDAEVYNVLIDDKTYSVSVNYSEWGAVVNGLPGCYNYTFVEEEVPKGYMAEAEEDINQTIITNTLMTDFVKVSTESNSKVINNAIFRMTTCSGSNKQSYFGKSGDNGKLTWYTTYTNGQLTGEILIADIPQGTYTLEEIVAPAGYLLNTSKWTLNVANGYLHVTHINDNQIKSSDYSKDSKSGVVTFFFKNEAVYELPSTGGHGIYTTMLSGFALMLGAAYVWFTSRGKESSNN